MPPAKKVARSRVHARASSRSRAPSRKAIVNSGARTVLLPPGYDKLLRELKARVRSAQAKAAAKVNQELVRLYLHIGKRIAENDGKGICRASWRSSPTSR